jgi:hypothetical protein
MSKSALNTTLQRTLKKGTQYNALFLASSCKPVSLGKGDTEYGINQIKDWILENINSIDSKLARKLFLGASLSETCVNIHTFLYTHFQYDADGYEQNLRSPNCSWAMRKQGIDCKSYSILASTLLLKCGYINILRRIQQPTYKPTEYTHIYVIVPINQTTGALDQGYHVVDGTIPTMYEPQHQNPHDIIMDLPYTGLKGATAPTTTQQQQQAIFIKGLTPFVSAENLFKINDYITRLIQAGIMPIYKQISGGFQVNELRIPLTIGMNGADDTTTDDSSGVDWQQTYDTISSSGWYNDTFGSIFSNGWDFSCWNSSFSPEEAKSEWVPTHVNRSLEYLSNNITPLSFEHYQMYASKSIGNARRMRKKITASCSKDGYKLAEEMLLKHREGVMNKIKQYYNIELVERGALLSIAVLRDSPTNPDLFQDETANIRQQGHTDDNPEMYKYDRYVLLDKIGSSGDIVIGDGTTDTTNNTGNTQQLPTAPTTQTAGTSKLFGGILLLTALGYAYNKYGSKKKANSTTSNKSK